MIKCMEKCLIIKFAYGKIYAEIYALILKQNLLKSECLWRWKAPAEDRDETIFSWEKCGAMLDP